MKTAFPFLVCAACVSVACLAQEKQAGDAARTDPGKVTSHSQGLHGYIGFGHEELPPEGGYSAGMGFYAAVWPLVDQPLADFQIGLPSSWIQPDNSDNKDQPLAPEGTLARTWKERGPTWSSVFQTVEGGLGYWAGNHFRYGPPKFSMNATPQCYDYEVGSPGWSFFYSNEALPDNRLGIAQLSNRLLIPPDAFPSREIPTASSSATLDGPAFTEPTTGDPPTGDQSGAAFSAPPTSKAPSHTTSPRRGAKSAGSSTTHSFTAAALTRVPASWGRRKESNTVPRFDSKVRKARPTRSCRSSSGLWSRSRAHLVQDVTYTRRPRSTTPSKPGATEVPPVGALRCESAFKPKLNTRTTRYHQAA